MNFSNCNITRRNQVIDFRSYTVLVLTKFSFNTRRSPQWLLFSCLNWLYLLNLLAPNKLFMVYKIPKYCSMRRSSKLSIIKNWSTSWSSKNLLNNCLSIIFSCFSFTKIISSSKPFKELLNCINTLISLALTFREGIAYSSSSSLFWSIIPIKINSISYNSIRILLLPLSIVRLKLSINNNSILLCSALSSNLLRKTLLRSLLLTKGLFINSLNSSFSNIIQLSCTNTSKVRCKIWHIRP